MPDHLRRCWQGWTTKRRTTDRHLLQAMTCRPEFVGKMSGHVFELCRTRSIVAACRASMQSSSHCDSISNCRGRSSSWGETSATLSPSSGRTRAGHLGKRLMRPSCSRLGQPSMDCQALSVLDLLMQHATLLQRFNRIVPLGDTRTLESLRPSVMSVGWSLALAPVLVWRGLPRPSSHGHERARAATGKARTRSCPPPLATSGEGAERPLFDPVSVFPPVASTSAPAQRPLRSLSSGLRSRPHRLCPHRCAPIVLDSTLRRRRPPPDRSAIAITRPGVLASTWSAPSLCIGPKTSSAALRLGRLLPLRQPCRGRRGSRARPRRPDRRACSEGVSVEAARLGVPLALDGVRAGVAFPEVSDLRQGWPRRVAPLVACQRGGLGLGRALHMAPRGAHRTAGLERSISEGYRLVAHFSLLLLWFSLSRMPRSGRPGTPAGLS